MDPDYTGINDTLDTFNDFIKNNNLIEDLFPGVFPEIGVFDDVTDVIDCESGCDPQSTGTDESQNNDLDKYKSSKLICENECKQLSTEVIVEIEKVILDLPPKSDNIEYQIEKINDDIFELKIKNSEHLQTDPSCSTSIDPQSPEKSAADAKKIKPKSKNLNFKHKKNAKRGPKPKNYQDPNLIQRIIGSAQTTAELNTARNTIASGQYRNRRNKKQEKLEEEVSRLEVRNQRLTQQAEGNTMWLRRAKILFPGVEIPW